MRLLLRALLYVRPDPLLREIWVGIIDASAVCT